ncbi:MAG TPA: precorrin-3B C(17)-methyltransferase [Deltaproteobacteria bacterium]|nr:precorrin-3B C(17)-methyltransferase [Deltaproteobacteria bacterium]
MAQCNHGSGQGKLYVVGTGPGSAKHMTPAAGEALGAAEVIVGYQTYLDLIPEFLVGKEVIASQMMKEVDRCRKALDLAAEGKKVALVSGGDPGIYAMAGLVFEMAREQGSSVDIEVIAGIAAINACAARLGAPLMHDFAAVSLSDLLTPWEKIEKRLEAAASADFVLAIYNPKSKKRAEHIVRAREILLAHRAPETPVGIVTAATRENERIVLTTLGKMLESEIDMQTTIIVGNSMTFAWQGFMVTPRGYAAKYAL